MPTKLKLSGEVKRIRQIRNPLNKQTFWWCLDFNEGGSPAAPKGLPKSSTIDYTAILNERTYNRLMAEMEPHGVRLKGAKVFIDGEITIDQPMDIVTGEIGVIVYTIESVEVNKIKRDQEAAAAAAEAEGEQQPEGV